jgi:hypothetical protein
MEKLHVEHLESYKNQGLLLLYKVLIVIQKGWKLSTSIYKGTWADVYFGYNI